MTTSAVISFLIKAEDKPASIVYRHADGYPEGVGIDLLSFVYEIRKSPSRNNPCYFDDSPYLAAK